MKNPAYSPGDSQSTTLLSENPPHRSFIARFQRWEWMLVALILVVVFVNIQLSP